MSDQVPGNLADLVREAAARRPDVAALVVGDGRLTWSDVDEQVDLAAAGLIESGLTQGDRLALLLGNSAEFVVAYFAALRAGLVAVPLNPGFTPPEIARLLDHSGARLVVADHASLGALRATDTEIQVVVTGASVAGETRFDDLVESGHERSPVPSNMTTEQLAVILYTSGTSGDPKGAMLTHRALRASVEQVASSTPIVGTEDVVLMVLPLSHIYSLNGTLGAVVRQAATMVLQNGFVADEALQLVRDQGVTNIAGAPAMWAAWSTRADLASAFAGVRRLFNGSAALPIDVHQRISDATGLFVHEGYGLTEAAPGVSSTLVSGATSPGSVGQPFPGVNIRLVDEAGNDVDSDDGDPGEIWIRGENLFSGYWPDGSDGPDQDGWYATGDVAYLDTDGNLHLIDRRKELVIVNGFNVYPREVELVLLEHRAVAEVAVLSISSVETGEAVKALVVLTPGSTTTPSELAEHCSARLARFKRPSVIEIVDQLPHSLVGKVAKGKLRQQLGISAAPDDVRPGDVAQP